jgi:heterodisulfide reductase subunit A
VKEVRGKAGDFHVKILRKARFVDENECTACGLCAEKCPSRVPDSFEMGIGTRKAIYLYFPQGIPPVYTIDKDHCIMLTKGKCGVCQKRCPKGAIDFEQQDTTVELDVRSIVVATGFKPMDPTPLTQYGYGRYKNVITAMEYERIISASGPTHGHLERPSDSRLAKKIGYIQCVGSRSFLRAESPFCSAVCCMHATKEAMLAVEHDKEAKPYIFYTDFRAVGKGFQKYVKRGEKDYGITYIRSRVGEIEEDKDQNPVVWYEDTKTQRVQKMTLDLVVLSTSLIPYPDAKNLASILGIETDEWNFIKTDPYFPVKTTREGIFACGYCQGPLDIPESVAQASSAAACAAEYVGVS